MRLPRFLFCLSVLSLGLARAADAVIIALDRLFVSILAIASDPRAQLATMVGPLDVARQPVVGQSIAAALVASLRHEARTPRTAAPRGI